MLAEFAIRHRVFIAFCVFLLTVGGIYSYFSLGRLEDPEFTIKTACVVTVYPGATSEEVETKVTDVVERAVQKLKNLNKIRSVSKPGLSIVFVDLKDSLSSKDLPENWQELRNKLKEIRLDLPTEAVSPIVQDDFAEVYGIVLALSSDVYSPAQLRDKARDLQRELQLIDQVGRVELWGVQKECVEIEISRAKIAKLSIHPMAVVLALQGQNLTVDAGKMTVDGDQIRISPQGTFLTLDEIGDLVIPNGNLDELASMTSEITSDTRLIPLTSALIPSDRNSSPIRLRDIATIRRTYVSPPSQIFRSNGKTAVALAISPIKNGNVIKMGKLVHQKAQEILTDFPIGYELDVVSYQPDNVNVSIHAFMKNLYEALIIVTIVVMIAMGWRSGLLITSSLLVVILATILFIHPFGIVLHRVSLGAFIVAIGILVDDAVVVGDLILVRMQRGMPKEQACIEGANRARYQLLGATIVGFIAFFPVYLSQDKTGEYCKDLFLVLTISLTLSWFVAMIQTPIVYYWFVRIKPPKNSAKTEDGNNIALKDPHGGPVYRIYRSMLETVLRRKTIAFGILISMLVVACWGFTHVETIFFPRATRKQFMIDYWLPEGSSIETVSADMSKIEKYLLELKAQGNSGITEIASFIGGGPPRFYLPYEPEIPNSSYAQLIVNVETTDDVDKLLQPTEDWILENFPQCRSRVQRFSLGPTTKSELEVRFRGSDKKVLRNLAIQAEKILNEEPKAKYVNVNWRQQTPMWTPMYSQSKGARANITRSEVAASLRWATSGVPVGQFGEGENMLPIYVRATADERNDLANIESTPVWGRTLSSVPLAQILTSTRFSWEEGQIHRRNRVPTITVGADARNTSWMQLQNAVKDKMEAIELPPGYSMEWGGQLEESGKAQGEILSHLPIALIIMAIIVVGLFNGLRQPFIIMLTFPLAMIGITIGLLVLGKPFGFMALVGMMSLLGMMVRNGVVLMDQIDEEMRKGESPYDAIVDAAVERMRPVTVAAMTVVVGMIPLLSDPLFDSMATAIMFGLIFATILTLFVVPAFYMILFRVQAPKKQTEK